MNKSIKILFNWFLGPLIFIVLSWSLYKQIMHQPDVDNRWQQIKNSFYSPLLWLSCSLAIVNWGLEALKWQRLLAPLENISFFKAFKSVLAGCSITMLTPNRVGEYGGRILFVSEPHRIDAIPLTILGSMGQLFITIFMGVIGLLYFKLFSNGLLLFQHLPTYTSSVLLWGSILLAIVLILIYLEIGVLVRLLTEVRLFKKLVAHIVLLKSFSRKQLLRILFLSFLRYSVFVLQFILLLQVMQVQISFIICFWLLTVFYLLMAVAPTIGLTELPIRVAASVVVLQLYSSNIVGIQAATFGIWIINLVVPAIIGSLFILGTKILKEK
ncbi:lysylphosphatidylglycerol synthase transmembrane domain-containing protein [Ferruginibacter yonginensis]|uniref:Lysylphosphatidylglycerol synthase transmembrane domain-containing protein n=1 Tax=Ferruginibacter yonginensis TaxID=1310416 RepID=A0ABV8QT39_9BACT